MSEDESRGIVELNVVSVYKFSNPTKFFGNIREQREDSERDDNGLRVGAISTTLIQETR